MFDIRSQSVLRWATRVALILPSLVLVLFLVFAIHSHSVSAPVPSKVWSIDLGSDRDFHQRLTIEEVLLDPPSIGFLNDAQLICGFYSSATSVPGEEKVSDGYHVLKIAVDNGSLGTKLAFDAFEREYKVLPVADGGFAVFAGDELKKFSRNFEPGAMYSMKRLQGGRYFDRWRIDVSPTGDSILVYSHLSGQDSSAMWTWLHTTDLTPIKSIEAPPTAAIQASDTAGIFFSADDEEILLSGNKRVLCSRCKAYFLADDMLFLDYGGTYSIESVAGKRQGNGDLGFGGANFTRSMRAPRFAYVTGHYVGSGAPLQTKFDSITAEIRVWDWARDKVIAEIDVNEPAGNPSAGLSQMALALSPEGKYLAVLLHHTLSLYRLPESE